MKIGTSTVYGFEAAFFSMRNPLESWDKSDTIYQYMEPWADYIWDKNKDIICMERPVIGPEDMKLAKKLIKAGASHRKFIREIEVWVNLNIGRDIWTELDTYKVATVRMSCSTMHKLGRGHLSVIEDFDFVEPDYEKYPHLANRYRMMKHTLVKLLNDTSDMFAETKDFDLVRCMKKIHPEGRLQFATYKANYQTLISIYHDRKNHRLPEWNTKDTGIYSICNWIEDLPYMKEFLSIKQT